MPKSKDTIGEGVIGPLDLSNEAYRTYSWVDPQSGERVEYTVNEPVSFFYRQGGSSHRILDKDGVVHCVPAMGHFACVIKWKGKSGIAMAY